MSPLGRFKRALGGPLLEASAALRAARHPPADPGWRPFVVFGRGRSGSTLLVQMLEAHPELSCLGEILRYPPLSPVRYVENRLRALPTPRRGFKLLSYQVRGLRTAADRAAIRVWLVDRDARVIRLRRENLFDHAVSNIYAARRGAYHSTDRRAGRHLRLRIEVAELRGWMEGSAALLSFEDDFLGDLPRLELGYERDLATGAARSAAFRAVADYLGVPHLDVQPSLQRVTPRDYRDLILNYREIEAGLGGTDLARYLPG